MIRPGDLTLRHTHPGSGSHKALQLTGNRVDGIENLLGRGLISKHPALTGQAQVLITLFQPLFALLQKGANISHPALVSCGKVLFLIAGQTVSCPKKKSHTRITTVGGSEESRSEERTSELQSRGHRVCHMMRGK